MVLQLHMLSDYKLYLNPLHSSPLSSLAASTLSYVPFLGWASLLSIPSMTSSRSPRSLRAFSRFKRIKKTREHTQPMAMYASTIPWPRVYHGRSSARYYLPVLLVSACGSISQEKLYNVRCNSAVDVAAREERRRVGPGSKARME